MKQYWLSILLLFPLFAYADTFEPNTSFQACFTPTQQCTPLIVDQINQAQHSIYIQAYTFTSAWIVKALIAAHQRGVDIEVIADKSQFKYKVYSRVKQLIKAGIPVWKDYNIAIAHNKVMIFDKAIVQTGSFNYSASAEKSNAENVLIIASPKLAALYLANWQARQKISRLMPVTESKRPRW
jgi:phosphatidylserine/phosphatidylglycerophosphate/cardiolipin synthase-like enzyme